MDMTNEQFLRELDEEFTTHVIPFWEGLADPDRGGFYGELDSGLVLYKDADKGCILNSRILWFFSNLYLEFRKQEYLDYARIAYRELTEHFLDSKCGGVFWSVTAAGEPADTQKHTYNQAFAIYGLASYFEASGETEALAVAWNLFQIIEIRCRDEGGYLEAFTRDFGPMDNEKLSENGVMATRTMNTLLHVMEAYTELFRVAEGKEDAFLYEIKNEVGDRLCEILHLFRDEVYNPERRRMEVFFDADYNTLIDLSSYGHDIETAWLIDRTVEILGAAGTEYDLGFITAALAREVYTAAYDGYDPEGEGRVKISGQIGHSIPAECEKGVKDESRVWWIQSEGIVGFLNEYQRTRDEAYLTAAKELWSYTKTYLIDRREGSCWYGYLHADGTPKKEKCIADEWTCPYHSGRMWLEVRKRLAVKPEEGE